MKVSVLNSTEDFKEIADDWLLIYSLSKGSSIFQSFEFNYSSWKNELSLSSGNILALTLVLKNNQIVSIFPFYIDRYKRLRFINDNHVDFCDFITKEVIDFSKVYLELVTLLDFKSIHLINIRKEGNIYNSACNIEVPCKIINTISQYSDLKVNTGEFPYNVPHYRSHQKHRINKALKQHKGKEHQILSINSSEFPWQELEQLKIRMIALGIREKYFLPTERLKLIEELYNSGSVILSIIRDQNELEGVNIILKSSSSSFLFWIDLFSDIQVINIVNYIRFIQHVSLENKVEINFGRGSYFYKRSNFAPQFHKLYGLYLFANQWQKIRFSIFDTLTQLIRLIYKTLKR